MKCRCLADLGRAVLTEAWNQLVQRVKPTLHSITAVTAVVTDDN